MSVTLNYEISYLNPKIVFVSGGPGSGKGTQCERLVRDYHFEHISVGDLVRDEVKRGTPEGLKFKDASAKGELVPDHLVVALIIKAIKSRKSFRFLIDGFPRNVEQAKMFEMKFKEIDYILNFEVPDEILTSRLMGRGASSGRADDNPEAIANRLRVFHNETQPVLDFYNHFGKVKTMDGSKSVDEVYKQVQEQIKPNLIFMYGPPCVGKTETARRLSEKIKYHFVNLEAFDKQHLVKSETDRINKLINYLQDAPYNNFIIDSFFNSKNDAEVFLKHFSLPFRIFYFDSPKDEVMNNIQKYILDEKERKRQKDAYEQFIKCRGGILSLIQNQPYFVKVNSVDTIPNIIKFILNNIRPLVISAFTYNNTDLALDYCDQLEKQRDFIYLDVSEQCQSEIERGTNLGAKMNAFEQSGKEIPPKFQVELLQKILFANPKQRRFIITKFPERNNQFEHFERELFPIDYLITFYMPQQQVKYYHDNSPLLQFFAKGKYIHIDRLALDIVDAYINERSNYGFVLGPQASGKSSIAKYIASKFGYTLIDWEQTFEFLKTKLGGEEGPLDELTYEQVEKYFAETLNPAKNPSKTLFDGWPSVYNFAQFQQFIKKLGLPSLGIDLQINKDIYIRRYKIKNEMDPEAEMSEEDQQKIDDLLANASQYTQLVSQTAESNFGFTLYKLDVNHSLESTTRYLNNIFFKRVYVVNDYTTHHQQEVKEEQKLVFLNFCAKTNTTFVDVQEIIKLNYWQKTFNLHDQVQSEYAMRWTDQQPTFPSNYSPKLIIQAISNYLKTLKIPSRDILLYGYPSGDTPAERSSNERFYPRASDEIYNIEKEVGPVRMVLVLTDNRLTWQINDEARKLDPPPEKPKKAADEEGQEEEPPAEEEEEGKPKFNIFDYEWTTTNGLPKTIPQWYNKLKKTQKKHYSIKYNGSLNTYDKLLEYLRLINEENPENKAEQEYRKVNLFVQLRYDEVPEHEENEVEPPREQYKHIVPEEPKLILPEEEFPEEQPQQVEQQEEEEEEN
ncbi:hypothetical protein ABPG74_011722 [Tetrahymena malaccensis]